MMDALLGFIPTILSITHEVRVMMTVIIYFIPTLSLGTSASTLLRYLIKHCMLARRQNSHDQLCQRHDLLWDMFYPHRLRADSQ
jgi:hypothetical protein